MTSIPRARLSHRAGKRKAPFLGPDTGNAQARGIEVIRHGSRCAHLPTCYEDIAAAPRRKLLPVGTAQPRGRRMPLDEAMARNIAPGSTAGLPGLVLSAGLTTGGLPVALANRNCPDSAYLGEETGPKHRGSFRDLPRLVQGHGGANQSLQRLLVYFLALVEVDGTLVFPSRLELKRPAGSLS